MTPDWLVGRDRPDEPSELASGRDDDLLMRFAARGHPAPAAMQALLGAPRTLEDQSRFGAVIFACGFRPDYESWVRIPGVVDELGFPIHHDGASTVVEGLFFVGVHFLRKRKSALFSGACEDAPIVAGQIAARHTSSSL